MSEIIELKIVAEKLSFVAKKILKFMSDKEDVTFSELKTLTECNDNKLYVEMKILDTLCLIESKKDEKKASKKRYFSTGLGDKIIKYLD